MIALKHRRYMQVSVNVFLLKNNCYLLKKSTMAIIFCKRWGYPHSNGRERLLELPAQHLDFESLSGKCERSNFVIRGKASDNQNIRGNIIISHKKRTASLNAEKCICL